MGNTTSIYYLPTNRFSPSCFVLDISESGYYFAITYDPILVDFFKKKITMQDADG